MDAGQGFGPPPWPGDRCSGKGLERVSRKSSGPGGQQAAEVSVAHPRPTLAEACNPRTPLPRQPLQNGILPSLSPPPPSSSRPGAPWPQGSHLGCALAWYTVPRRQLVPLPFLVFAQMWLRTPYSELTPPLLRASPPRTWDIFTSLLLSLCLPDENNSSLEAWTLLAPSRRLKHKCLLSE